jgi:hypothetical protein
VHTRKIREIFKRIKHLRAKHAKSRSRSNYAKFLNRANPYYPPMAIAVRLAHPLTARRTGLGTAPQFGVAPSSTPLADGLQLQQTYQRNATTSNTMGVRGADVRTALLRHVDWHCHWLLADCHRAMCRISILFAVRHSSLATHTASLVRLTDHPATTRARECRVAQRSIVPDFASFRPA